MKKAKDREIEIVELKVKDLNTKFGNPRKITRKKKEELADSLEDLGDFGLIVVDENNSIIAGNQRVSVLMEKDPEETVLCKRLVGYTESEKRAINIRDNLHSGEWAVDLLAPWTADLNLKVGIKIDPDLEERKIPEMELIRYEKYDYVLIACRSETDYNDLLRKLGLENAKVPITKTRKIKARAVWYENIAHLIKYKDKGGKK